MESSRSRRSDLRARFIPAILLLAYASLLITWVWSNPPFASPDENWHYIRALSVGGGEIIGEPARIEGLSPIQSAWVNQTTRLVSIPKGMSPAGYDCNAYLPRESAACMLSVDRPGPSAAAVTPVGNYQPALYFIPGIVARLATEPAAANRIGRLAAVVGTLLLFGIAIFALWDRRTARSLLGPMLAITPSVLFFGSAMSPSGGEIASSIAFFALLIAVMRSATPRPWIWLCLAFSGTVLVLARSTGPLWLALYAIIVLAWIGPTAVWKKIVSPNSFWVMVTSAVLTVAVALNRIWEGLYGPDIEIGFSPLSDALGSALGQVPSTIRQSIGVFGNLEVQMPLAAILAWLGAVLIVALLAWLVGGRRDRLALAIAVGLAVLVPVLLQAGVFRHTGFVLQARNVLPIVIPVPLISGEIVLRNWNRLGQLRPSLLTASGAVVVAIVQLVAWYSNSRRSAVGSEGPIWFAGHSLWTPPGGWVPPAAAALFGAVLIFAVGLSSLRDHGGSDTGERLG